MIPFEKNRSYRRFYQNDVIPESALIKMIDAARLSPTGKNVQPLKYYISVDPITNSTIFSTLAWAGYLKDWSGPEEGERPSAYIVQLHDKSISDSYFCDHGIAAQSILLQAVDLGYGGCIIASVQRGKLRDILELPVHLEILQVFALGKPKEIVVIDLIKDGDYKYWRDENRIHHVPKRGVDELIFKLKK